MQSLLYGLFSESPWNSESVQIPYKIINDSLWAKLTCFPYNNIYIICYHYTTHRRMQDMGFSCRIPCVKPLLNNRQRQKRLTWAKDKKDWTAAEWSKVMFSDESKFCISFGNQGPRVWRKRGEAQNPRCLRSSVKFPHSVMVWGVMSSAGVGPLCFLRSKVNTAVYQEVLEHFMLPAADQLYGDADFIFQQDLAPAHSAKATSTWFKDHGFPVLNWPANSPDLNPIENLWVIVKRKMRYARPNNA